MYKSSLKAMSGIIMLTMVSSVFAEQGIDLGGKFDAKVNTGNLVNAGIGYKADADASIASLSGNLKLNGGFKSSVNAQNVVNAAIGYKSKAELLVGSIKGPKAN